REPHFSRNCIDFSLLSLFFFFFFFQAEDGIRDLYVTGVQTCALPISKADGKGKKDLRARKDKQNQICTIIAGARVKPGDYDEGKGVTHVSILRTLERSEERRVGKECRSRGSPDHEKKKSENEDTDVIG